MHCEECGYEYDELSREEIADTVRWLALRYAEPFTGVRDPKLTAHPTEGVWSPLEYACHIRDVLRIQRDRVLRAQVEDVPEFVSMNRDERVASEHYNEQDPAFVASEIGLAGEALAATFASLLDADWERTGIYSYPTKEVRTVEWIGRHTIHELTHHLMDIERLLA